MPKALDQMSDDELLKELFDVNNDADYRDVLDSFYDELPEDEI